MAISAIYAERETVDFNKDSSLRLRAFWIGVVGQALALATLATAASLNWSLKSTPGLVALIRRIISLSQETFEAVKAEREREPAW